MFIPVSYTHLDVYKRQGQANRFLNLMRDVEKRGLPPAELAETYRQVNRLLSASDGATLGPIDRARLSEQILYETAYPGSIDQGNNSTCNVTCLETRAFEADPASAARLITDVALTGKYLKTPLLTYTMQTSCQARALVAMVMYTNLEM